MSKENGLQQSLMELLKNDDAAQKVHVRPRFKEDETRLLKLASYTLGLNEIRIQALEEENNRLKKAASDASWANETQMGRY